MDSARATHRFFDLRFELTLLVILLFLSGYLASCSWYMYDGVLDGDPLYPLLGLTVSLLVASVLFERVDTKLRNGASLLRTNRCNLWERSK